MARTPSMSPQEAMAAIGVVRGDLNIQDVTPERHKLLRKWATANGIPGAYAASMKRWKLVNCYNVGDDSDFGVEWHKRNAERTGQTQDAIDDDKSLATEPVQHTMTVTAPPVEHVTAAHAVNDAGKLAGVLADILAKGGCNPDMVRAIVDEKLAGLPELVAKYSNHVTLELKKHDGASYRVDGHVHPKFSTLVQAMDSRQANGRHPNIMLVGPTGSGKTHAVEQAAKALGLDFFTNGAISMDHQLIGFVDAGGKYHETPLRKAFGQPAVYLFDEIDSSDNSPLLCLAGALANGGFAFPDCWIDRHPDSIIIAAGNTWGHGASSDFVGRNKLDGAIRSRFPVRIHWDYDEKLERAISGNVDWACRVQKARANARRAGLKVIIDPRMTQAGAGLVASGMDMDTAASLTYLADLSDDQRKIVEAA